MDYRKSMAQSFEFYKVDPETWRESEKITCITECKVTYDSTAETLGSATLSATEELSECYVRVYLVAIQDDVTERIPIATVLLQTPGMSFDGKVSSREIEGYMPLLELKEKLPDVGYTIGSGANILDRTFEIASLNARCPVVRTKSNMVLSGSFIAQDDDTLLSYLADFIALMDYHFDIDALGRVLFAPDTPTESLNPVWEFNDGNSSILYPDIEVERDLYGIPNVVQVIYSTEDTTLTATARNTNSDSITSIQTRGREVMYRESNPDLDDPTADELQEYAENLLAKKNSLEYTISYSHGYCPVRVGDCVLLNYTAAGLVNIRAKVAKQVIDCSAGCKVEETAVFTRNLLEG